MREAAFPTRRSSSGFPKVKSRFVRAAISAVALLAVLAGVAWLLWVLTGKFTGLGRVFVAVVMFAVIAWFGIGYFRQLGNSLPPDLPPDDVDPELGLAYVCDMCGLELAVVKASKESAPKHCGEAMVLVQH